MNKFALAARSQIRNVLLCAIVTIPLAACGGSDEGSAAVATPAATDSASGLASVNVGMIARTADVDGAAGVASVASTTTASNTTAPSTAATTPAAGTSTSGTKTTAPVNGVATLDWMPPTQNTDGSTLTNLAGYTVYYGTSPSDLTQSVKVSNPGLTAYSVTGLTSGTWYFAVTSYSADGVESARTTTVSTQI
jgi:hypothetical protein